VTAHPLDHLGDPVRRAILELLSGGERNAGDVVEAIRRRFGISQPAVSQHLRVLREGGFVTVRPEGSRRVYAMDPAPLQEVDRWLEAFRRSWDPRLDALGTEVARGKRERRETSTDSSPAPPRPGTDAGRSAAPAVGSGGRQRPGAA
jgi:DNA-binding transcriptional ArsR family regulator